MMSQRCLQGHVTRKKREHKMKCWNDRKLCCNVNTSPFMGSLFLGVAIGALISNSCAIASTTSNLPSRNELIQKNGHGRRDTALRAHRATRKMGEEETDYSYKKTWSECSLEGKELSGEECKDHVELDLIIHNHILQDYVEVKVLKDQDSMPKPNEVLIRTNRHGYVIGGNSSSLLGVDSLEPPTGLVYYNFKWGGENVGPFNCLGRFYDSCCELIQSQTPSSEEGLNMTCRNEVAYPKAIADAATGDVWFQEYVYNKATKKIRLVHQLSNPENVQMEIQILEGSDGKVHTAPQVNMQVIHQPPPDFAFSEMIAQATATSVLPSVDALEQTVMQPPHPGGGQPTSGAEAVMKGATSSVTQWWYGIPFGFLAFSVCFCCTALYVLCCIPIKDEDYLKDSEKVLENVREKKLDEIDVNSEPSGKKKVKRATSSSRIL